MLHTKCIGVFMTYAHTKLHMSNSNGSLVITIKPKLKYRFCVAPM